MSGKKKSGDDGVVTSAPASSVGSLLTDLLSEAKKDVAAERHELEQQQQRKREAERAAAAREEDKKRQAMQEKVIAETRLRNQALSQRDRGQTARSASSTAPQLVAKKAEPPKARPVSTLVALRSAPEGDRRWMILLAFLLVGGGLGLGAATLFTPAPKVAWPDMAAAAKSVAAQAAVTAELEAMAEARMKKAQGELAGLKTDLVGVKAAQTKLAEELEEARKNLAATEQELSDLRAQRGIKAPKRPPKKPPGPSIPAMDPSVFSP